MCRAAAEHQSSVRRSILGKFMTSSFQSVTSACGDGSKPTSPVDVSVREAREMPFLKDYGWSLNIYPTVSELLLCIKQEVKRYSAASEDWHRAEILTNLYLLSCAVSDTTDDFLSGPAYDFSKAAAFASFAAPAIRAFEKSLKMREKLRAFSHKGVVAWRDRFGEALQVYLHCFVRGVRSVKTQQTLAGLSALADESLPTDLREKCAKVPAAYRSQDLTHFDVLSLGDKFMAQFPDRKQPLVVVGSRTAGSYFAP